jgi:hypothetical protein
LIPISDNFLFLAILFCIDAFTETLFTGSDDAWVFDIIEKENPKKMQSFFLKRRSIGNAGMIFAGLV